MTKFFKTTISVDLYTHGKPADYDEGFWNHLRETLADQEGTLLAGTAMESKEITRAEAEEEVEDLDDRLDEVVCRLCHEPTPARTAHPHQGEWVGDDCCWDERLRATE